MQIWSFSSEHKIQSVLALLQITTVVAGMCFIKALGKLVYEDQDPNYQNNTAVNSTTGLLYDAGIWLIIIPALWVTLTIYLERKRGGRYQYWMTIASGLVLLLWLLWLFVGHNMRLITPVY